MAYDLSVAKARDPLITIAVFIVIAIVTCLVRLQSRKMRSVSLGLDDYLMLGALFCLFISIGIQIACVIAGGVGRHIAEVDHLDVVKTLKLILPFGALYGVTLCLIKCSIISFYSRIFGASKSFRISALVAVGILIAWALSVILETFLLCRPLSFNWDQTLANGVCGDRNAVYVTAGAVNVVTDFMVMALPVPHILTLQLHWRRKAELILMFSLGIFITIISVIRIKSLQVISFADPTYTLPMGLLWTTLEPCLCIINANMPMVRTYVVAVAPKMLGSTADQTTRIQTPTIGGSNVGLIGGSGRPSPSERIGDDRLGYVDSEMGVKMGNVGTESQVQGSRGWKVEENESESHLTKGDRIMVEKSVHVEST
ncbi:uncharacterized protein L3040_000154 [Drepanopeziza brunnea f. sp. 'multigermtubi']|uniref:uncharacterized protein n=1 Tax=Drepanopeziza brunnea f. sp. 'multigermtubi' TaxID=698441 RepID=UPI0023852B7B|nr:hypothetical protein L3040_000154 [Drepanopeziza brunnea f. sp. 'multigermtubi']